MRRKARSTRSHVSPASRMIPVGHRQSETQIGFSVFVSSSAVLVLCRYGIVYMRARILDARRVERRSEARKWMTMMMLLPDAGLKEPSPNSIVQRMKITRTALNQGQAWQCLGQGRPHDMMLREEILTGS